MTRRRDAGRFARVIASDLVHYFHAANSPVGSQLSARDFASHGLFLLRARFGHDDALERYYADCISSAFESLTLAAPSLETLRASATPFIARELPKEEVSIAFR